MDGIEKFQKKLNEIINKSKTQLLPSDFTDRLMKKLEDEEIFNRMVRISRNVYKQENSRNPIIKIRNDERKENLD